MEILISDPKPWQIVSDCGHQCVADPKLPRLVPEAPNLGSDLADIKKPRIFEVNINNFFDFDMAISYNADDSVRTRYNDWKHHVFPLTYTLRADRSNYRENQPKRNELLLVNY